jgi:hypothetical protein
MNNWAPVEPTNSTSKHRSSCPEEHQNEFSWAPVKLTSRKIYTPVQRSKPQNPNRRRTYSPVEPTQHDHKRQFDRWLVRTLFESRNAFPVLASPKNSMIEGSNQVQISPKYIGTITKVLWTCPQKESMNQSTVWEESKKFRARLGFSQEYNNFDSGGLVIPEGIALG